MLDKALQIFPNHIFPKAVFPKTFSLIHFPKRIKTGIKVRVIKFQKALAKLLILTKPFKV